MKQDAFSRLDVDEVTKDIKDGLATLGKDLEKLTKDGRKKAGKRLERLNVQIEALRKHLENAVESLAESGAKAAELADRYAQVVTDHVNLSKEFDRIRSENQDLREEVTKLKTFEAPTKPAMKKTPAVRKAPAVKKLTPVKLEVEKPAPAKKTPAAKTTPAPAVKATPVANPTRSTTKKTTPAKTTKKTVKKTS